MDEKLPYKATFEQDGFLIARDVIPHDLLLRLESSIKLGAQEVCSELGISARDLDVGEMLQRIERVDKACMKNVIGRLAASVDGFALVTSAELVRIISAVYAVPTHRIMPCMPGVFYNNQGSNQLQYEWHQEAAYYPNEGNKIVNVWMPIFSDVSEHDGPMLLKRNSHQRLYSYDIHFRADGYMQLQISDAELAALDTVPTITRRGDVVVFHSYTAHCTAQPKTNRPRLSLVCRYKLLSKDIDDALPLRTQTVARDEFISRANNVADFVE